jgi:outer membrane protein TolC
VLDAQRALIEARDQLNKALRDAHLRRIELIRLVGSMPDAGLRQGG